MRMPTDSPLLALVNATVEWRAGLEPRCSTHVRLLDRVHVAVHRGECVVVQHDDPAGAQVLLAALGGSRALMPGRRLRGARYCAPGVRIRRCSVSLEAADALQEGWAASPRRESAVRGVGDDLEAGRLGASPGPVVHLVRASRCLSLASAERRAWVRWAESRQRAGGALVLVVRPTPPITAALPSGPPDGPRSVLHENAAPAYTGAVQADAASVGQMAVTGAASDGRRTLWLHHGRLVGVPPCP